jgi:hypothetical protein
MNAQDEKIRAAVNDALTAANIDVRNLAIEVTNGRVLVKGTVPSTQQQERMAGVLSRCLARTTPLDCAVGVRDVAPSDSLDGRGRSPITGTSADSAHESRHQRDPD